MSQENPIPFHSKRCSILVYSRGGSIRGFAKPPLADIPFIFRIPAHVITSALVSRTRGIIQHFAHPRANAWASDWTSRGGCRGWRFIPERDAFSLSLSISLAKGSTTRDQRTFNQFLRFARRYSACDKTSASRHNSRAPRNLQSRTMIYGIWGVSRCKNDRARMWFPLPRSERRVG